MEHKTLPLEQLRELIGREQTGSDWVLVDQQRVDAFADVTIDHQFIHVDPDQAVQSPFGGTIAHGFLTLSLLTHLVGTAMTLPEGTVMGVNYGFDKIRFLTPVRVGARVRAKATLTAIDEKRAGQLLLSHQVAVEIDGEKKPALIADWLSLAFLG